MTGRRHLYVRAYDDPADLAKPRGKQDWQLEPHSIWYPAHHGHLANRVDGTRSVDLHRLLRYTPVVERWEIGFEARLFGDRRDGLRMTVKLSFRDQLIADDTYTVVAGEVHRRIALSDPGIDDYRNALLWTPSTPNLIDVEMKLWSGRGELIDQAIELYRAAVHRRSGRPICSEWPAVSVADGSGSGLLARHGPDGA